MIGWFDDLSSQLSKHHPDLVSDAGRAKASAQEFRDWLKQNQGRMNAKSGIGLDNYDYLQRYIRLMPYTSKDNLVLSQRELERSRAFLAIERWKNRKEPVLAPATRPRSTTSARRTPTSTSAASFANRKSSRFRST